MTLRSQLASRRAPVRDRLRRRRPCGTAGLLLAWLLVGLLAGKSRAQSIPLRHYAQDQGLLGLADTCLLETSHTPLWVCTESGLYRFDGQHFSEVALAGQRGLSITSVSRDADGRIWVASSGSLFVGDAHGFRKLDMTETGHLHQSGMQLASMRWGTVLLDDGKLLRLQPGGDGRWRVQPLFDASAIAHRPELGQVAAVFGDGDTLWLGCAKMLCKVDALGGVETLGPAQGVPSDYWYSVAHGLDGSLWVRGQQNVMQRSAGAARFELRPLSMLKLALVGRPADIAIDRQGRVLVLGHTGLARWEGDHWRMFDTADGLPQSSGRALLVDSDGDLWMAVDGEGVVRWPGYGWIENWDASQGMAGAPTWSILRDAGGGLLVGNEYGVSRQSPSGGRFLPWLPQAGQQVIGLQRAADGTLWSVNSAGRLMHYAVDGGDARQIAQLDHTARGMLIDREQRLWLPTTAGMHLLEHPADGGVPQRVAGLPPIQYPDIFQDSGGVLWAAAGDGVYRLRDGRWSPLSLSVDGHPVHDWVSALRVDASGELWLAFYTPGLWHGTLQGNRVELRPVDDPAFAELAIYLISLDRAGRLWVGHSQGVDVRAGGHWARLSQSQGLLSDDTSENAIMRTPMARPGWAMPRA